jgi:hypothetical protein
MYQAIKAAIDAEHKGMAAVSPSLVIPSEARNL